MCNLKYTRKFIVADRHKLSLFLNFLIILLVIASIDSSPAYAQQPNQWAPQTRIPTYDDLVNEQPPRLIVDQNHTVYAFNSQTLEDQRVIMYREWTREAGWTDPNDIFMAPLKGNIEVLDVFLDHDNMVHIVLAMGEDVYYSKTLLSKAYNASAWSTPELIGSELTQPVNGSIGGNDRGELVITYGGQSDGNGVYWVYSEADGNAWTEPSPLFFTYYDNLTSMGSQIYVGQSNQSHVVWNTVNQQGQGGKIYYSNFNFESQKWKEPITLAEKAKGGKLALGTLTPSVIEYNGNIIVSYYDGINNGNWWRLSHDRGETWTEPSQVSSQHVGTNGSLSFAIDSQNSLHAFFGQRINDLNHGMWHTIWTGYGWSTITPVVSGPQVRDEIGGNGFDPKSARAVISQGNVVLVTWVTDGFAGENGVWFSYTTLDTPELPTIEPNKVMPPVTIDISDSSVVTPSALITTTDSSTLPASRSIQSADDNHQLYPSVDEPSNNQLRPLMVGVANVVLIIAVFFIYQVYSRTSRL